MPFYDYKCSKCSTVFEIEKGMKETAKGLKCPKCGSTKADRVFTKVKVLKGDSALLDTHGTSGGNCNTCTDGVCDSCKGK